jgi:hypothetical protein
MMIAVSFISGVMLGLEFVFEDDLVVIDLFIVRLMIFYNNDGPAPEA